MLILVSEQIMQCFRGFAEFYNEITIQAISTALLLEAKCGRVSGKCKRKWKPDTFV